MKEYNKLSLTRFAATLAELMGVESLPVQTNLWVGSVM